MTNAPLPPLPGNFLASQDFIILHLGLVDLLDGDWTSAGILQRIAFRAGSRGHWRASFADIAAECRVSESTVKRATKKLREMGWLTAERENRFESMLTWRVVTGEPQDTPPSPLRGEAPESVSSDETAGQAREGQNDHPGENNVVTPRDGQNDLPGAANVTTSEAANLTSSEKAKMTFPSSKNVQELQEEKPAAQPASVTASAADAAAGGDQEAEQPEQPELALVHTTDEPEQPAEQETETVAQAANRIAREWYDHYERTYAPIVKRGNPFLALRDSLVRPALERGYTETEVKWALRGPTDRTPTPIPSVQQWQAALVAVREGREPGARQQAAPQNHHHSSNTRGRDQVVDAFEASRGR